MSRKKGRKKNLKGNYPVETRLPLIILTLSSSLSLSALGGIGEHCSFFSWLFSVGCGLFSRVPICRLSLPEEWG